jgi:hypothetical protein
MALGDPHIYAVATKKTDVVVGRIGHGKVTNSVEHDLS